MQTTESKWSELGYLTCEKRWIYFALITVAGFWGAYTYLLRGNVFCNAQTGNVVLMGLALGAGKWKETLYYVIPISAYLMGAFLSELVPNPVKHRLAIRWDTLLILVEMLAVLFLGFLPDSAPEACGSKRNRIPWAGRRPPQIHCCSITSRFGGLSDRWTTAIPRER